MKDKYLLIAAVVLGILAVILVNRQIAGYEKKAKRPTTQLYTAVVDIEAGKMTVQEAVGQNYLEPVRGVPKRFVMGYPEAIQENTMRAVMGETIHRPIRSGEFLLFVHLEEVDRADLERRLPPGRKIMTMPVTKQGTLSYFIQPGDVVDFYQLRHRTDPENPGGSTEELEKIASGIRILAGDDDWALDEGGPTRERGTPYRSITIAVDEKLWKQLMADQRLGPITFQLSEGATGGR